LEGITKFTILERNIYDAFPVSPARPKGAVNLTNHVIKIVYQVHRLINFYCAFT